MQRRQSWLRILVCWTASASVKWPAHSKSHSGIRLAHGFAIPGRQTAQRKSSALRISYDDFRERLPAPAVVDAVSKKRNVVAADIAAAAGVSIGQAESDLQALAALARADLAVSRDGDLVYSFNDGNLQSTLAQNSVKYKVTALARKVWPAVFWGIRVSFGALLLVSLAAIFSTILFIQTNANSNNDDRRDDNRGRGIGGGGSFGGFGSFWGPSPFDVFYYRPYGYYGYYGTNNNNNSYRNPDDMGLLESIFSYLFGDGNPNATLQTRRLQAVAQLIRQQGGAVTAEQLAPFCEDLPEESSSSSSYVDEGFVLPLVTALNGKPEVTEDGTIVYTFPELQVSALGKEDSSSSTELVDLQATAAQLEEAEWEFSLAPTVNKFLAGGLGVVNLGGALYLGNLLGQYALYGVKLPSYMGLVQAGYPLLLAYAVLFNAVPLVRKFWTDRQNAQIRNRNGRRRKFQAALQTALSRGEVGRKLRASRRFKTSMKRLDVTSTKSEDIVYDTKQPAWENQKRKQDMDLDEFDRKLREGSSSSSGSTNGKSIRSKDEEEEDWA